MLLVMRYNLFPVFFPRWLLRRTASKKITQIKTLTTCLNC